MDKTKQREKRSVLLEQKLRISPTPPVRKWKRLIVVNNNSSNSSRGGGGGLVTMTKNNNG
jgi:hypothetical protein